MKPEQPDRLDVPLFAHDAKLRALEEQLYGHVLAAIDLDRLAHLEQVLYAVLSDRGMASDLALDLSLQLVERALVRASDNQARFCDFGPPPGITEAERRAVSFDETCPICVGDKRAGPPSEPHEDEPCQCCDALAQSWREEHAEELARAGLTSSTRLCGAC